METKRHMLRRYGWALGALAFGLYYTAALAYFEPYQALGIRDQFTGATWGATLRFYLPVAAILVSVSLLLFWLQVRTPRRQGLAAGLRRWVVLPVGAYLIAVGLLWLYGLADGAEQADRMALAENLLSTVALVGLLPLQLLLISWPRLKSAVQASPDEPSQEPPSEAEAEPTGQPSEAAPSAANLAADAPFTAAPMLHLQPSHGESTFEIPASDLVMVEAADNYCKLHYLVAGQLRTKMVRVTMRDVETALQGLPGYHRCHRSFLVNAAMVEAIQGQSQAYRLKMRHLSELVPVSRSFDVGVL